MLLIDSFFRVSNNSIPTEFTAKHCSSIPNTSLSSVTAPWHLVLLRSILTDCPWMAASLDGYTAISEVRVTQIMELWKPRSAMIPSTFAVMEIQSSKALTGNGITKFKICSTCMNLQRSVFSSSEPISTVIDSLNLISRHGVRNW